VNKWKDILSILKWVLLIGYLVVILGFVKNEHQTLHCKNLSYIIDKKHAFVDTSDIFNILTQDSMYPLGYKTRDISVNQIEDAVEMHPAIQNSEAFLQLDGSLFIEVKQRNPVMRVITVSNMHYYVDDQNSLMNTGCNYTADVPVLSGHLPDTLVMAFKNGNDTLKLPGYPFTMNKLIEFAGFLYHDAMWRNLIVQIFINKEHEFELVSRVGIHIIVLGSLDDYAYKMKKLEALYKKAFSEFGWNKYKTINLKYSNQVVCSKK
jgi:cell division protein FtsQ